MTARARPQHSQLRLLWAVLPGLLWAGAQAYTLGGTPGLAVFWLFLWCGTQMLAEPGDESSAHPVVRTIAPLLGFFLVGALAWWVILPGPLAAGGETGIQIFAYGWLAIAVWLFFLDRWWCGTPGHSFTSTAGRGLLWLSIAASLLQSASLWAALYWQRASAEKAAAVLLAVLAVLILEFAIRWLARLYQPAEIRRPLPFLWRSWLLQALGGGRAGWRKTWQTALDRWEEISGSRLEGAWLPRQIARLFLPVILVAVILAWLSTAVTIVPVGHTGVRETFGRFSDQGQPAGPQGSWPAPWGKIHLVNTGEIRSFSVGFTTDLELPVLWNEKHLEGEENFLVGDGDEILTINLPVFWRVAEAPRFLQSVQDASATLAALAQQQLLRALQGQDIFALMSTERDRVAREIRAGLTAAAQDLALGVEIVFVGLQDIHPPVQVAEAYQAVAAAEEEQQAVIERAVAYRVERILEARMESFTLRTRAETAAAEVLLDRQTHTALPGALIPAAAESRAALYFRLQEEAWTRLLSGREKVILPGGSPESLLFDLRDLRSFPSP